MICSSEEFNKWNKPPHLVQNLLLAYWFCYKFSLYDTCISSIRQDERPLYYIYILKYKLVVLDSYHFQPQKIQVQQIFAYKAGFCQIILNFISINIKICQKFMYLTFYFFWYFDLIYCKNSIKSYTSFSCKSLVTRPNCQNYAMSQHNFLKKIFTRLFITRCIRLSGSLTKFQGMKRNLASDT